MFSLLIPANSGPIRYDRNDKTVEAFKEHGFEVIGVKELLKKFENDELDPETMKNTLILMPSSELSRARGGFHCMSMPLLRDKIVWTMIRRIKRLKDFKFSKSWPSLNPKNHGSD